MFDQSHIFSESNNLECIYTSCVISTKIEVYSDKLDDMVFCVSMYL